MPHQIQHRFNKSCMIKRQLRIELHSCLVLFIIIKYGFAFESKGESLAEIVAGRFGRNDLLRFAYTVPYGIFMDEECFRSIFVLIAAFMECEHRIEYL